MTIRNVEFINARTKVCHCVVNNLGVDITINQAGALKTVVFIEECDTFIGKNHLFKRSVLLVKAWAIHESAHCAESERAVAGAQKSPDTHPGEGHPILGSKTGMLSSYAVSVLVLYLFNRYPALNHPLSVLTAFLHTYAHFPWESCVLTLHGPQPIQNGHTGSISYRRFPIRSCNIQDPVDPANNLGYSVSRSNLAQIELSLRGGQRVIETAGPYKPYNAALHQGIPDNERGDMFNTSEDALPLGLTRRRHSGSSGSINQLGASIPYDSPRDDMSDSGLRRNQAGDIAGNSEGMHAGFPGAEELSSSNLRFLHRVFPNCFKEFILPQGGRADLLDHPMQNMMLSTHNPGGPLHVPRPGVPPVRFHSPSLGTAALGDSNPSLDAYVRDLHSRGNSSQNALKGSLKELWDALRDESARRNGTYAYHNQGVSTQTPSVPAAQTVSVIQTEPVIQKEPITQKEPVIQTKPTIQTEPTTQKEPVPLEEPVTPSLSSASNVISKDRRIEGRNRTSSVPQTSSNSGKPPLIPSPPRRAVDRSTEGARHDTAFTLKKNRSRQDEIADVGNRTTLVSLSTEARDSESQDRVLGIAAAEETLAAVPSGHEADMIENAGDVGGEDSDGASSITCSSLGSVSGSRPSSPIHSPSHGVPRYSPNAMAPGVFHTNPKRRLSRPSPIDVSSNTSRPSFNPFDALASPTAAGSTAVANPETYVEPGSPEDEVKDAVLQGNVRNGPRFVAAGGGGDSVDGAMITGKNPKKNKKKKRSASQSNLSESNRVSLAVEAEAEAEITSESALSPDPLLPDKETAVQNVGEAITVDTHAHSDISSRYSILLLAAAAVAMLALGVVLERNLGSYTREESSKNHILMRQKGANEIRVSSLDAEARPYDGSDSNSGDASETASSKSSSFEGSNKKPRYSKMVRMAHLSGEHDYLYDDDGVLFSDYTARKVRIAESLATAAAEAAASTAEIEADSKKSISVRENLSENIAKEERPNTINGYHYAHSSTVAPFTHWLKAGSSLSFGPNDIQCPLSGIDLSSVFRAKRAYKEAMEIHGRVDLTSILDASRRKNESSKSGVSDGDEDENDLKVTEEQFQLLLGAFLRDVEVVEDSSGCTQFHPEPTWQWQHNGMDIGPVNGYIYESDSGYYEGGKGPILTIKNAQRRLTDRSVNSRTDSSAVADPHLTHEGVYSCVLRFGTAPYVSPHAKSSLQPLNTEESELDAVNEIAEVNAPRSGFGNPNANGNMKILAEAAAEMDTVSVSGRSTNKATYNSILSKDGHLLGYNNDLGLTFAMKNNYAVGNEKNSPRGGRGGKMMVEDDYFEILVTQVAVRVSTVPVITSKIQKGQHYEYIEGGDLFLSVHAQSYPPPSFQWYRNGNKLQDQTKSFLSIPSVRLEHAGAYTCEISNLAGSVTFEDISVSVNVKAKPDAHKAASQSTLAANRGGSKKARSSTSGRKGTVQPEPKVNTQGTSSSPQNQNKPRENGHQQGTQKVQRDEHFKGGLKGEYPTLNSNPKKNPVKRKDIPRDEPKVDSDGANLNAPGHTSHGTQKKNTVL
eukprot:GSChrysophyteH1.ASY1.ANO1.3265.1 assembled CDS